MFEQISRLETLYAWRGVLFHSRVMPVWVLFLLAIGSWWLLGLGFDWAFDGVWLFVLLMVLTFIWRVWPGHWLFRKHALKQARQFIKRGDGSSAYQIYQKLNRLAVFPWEKAAAQLELAWFLYEAGNLKRAYAMANNLVKREADLTEGDRVSLAILQAVQHEDAQAYGVALTRLNQLLETIESPRLKMQVYNQRGRIYTHLHQLDFAQSEYEKTYALFKSKPEKAWFSVIVHNLLLNYARQGSIEKAEVLIDEYQSMLGKHKHEDWLEFSNDLLHAGREANHQAWLERAYAIQQEVVPQNDDEAFALGLSELRMRLNDALAFEQSYQKFMPKLKARLAQGSLDLNQKLYMHRELMHVLKAKLQQTRGAEPWWQDFQWLVTQSQAWLPLVDRALIKVDTALPNEKVHWLKAKQRVLKDSLAFESDLAQLKSKLSDVVKIQQRVIDEWQVVDNLYQRVEEQIILVDDAMSYTAQALSRDEHEVMVTVFKVPAEAVLDDLVAWALELKSYRGQEHRVVFIAFALLRMRGNIPLAKSLMDKLHTEPFSLKHYALFVREQYEFVNKVMREG